MIVGLSGKAGTGKTTFADIAAKEFGFKKLSFATGVKEEVAEFLTSHHVKFEPRNLYGSQADKEEVVKARPLRGVSTMTSEGFYFLTDFVQKHGLSFNFRTLMQWWGTELRRNHFGDDYWVKRLMQKISDDPDCDDANFIVDDVRYVNEADAIKEGVGGVIIRIERTDRPQISNPDHISETALDGYLPDSIVLNNSTLRDFEKRVKAGFSSITDRTT